MAILVGLLDFSDLVSDGSVVELLKVETVSVVCGGDGGCRKMGALLGFELF